MKAAQIKKYDKSNINVEIVEIDRPKISDNEVLVKVKAAGINPVDNMTTRGEVKLIIPYKLPLIVGHELVGIVEEIGKNVTKFAKGDRVFARLPLNKIGAFAEYATVSEDALAKVPEYLNDVEAAAIPLTALTVMQSLELMNIQEGKSIFISGGTGGVGAMAIPIAKAKGLYVITNGSADNRDRVLSLGADEFIDYKTQDYTQILSNIDFVLDTLGGAETEKQMSIMKKGGRLVSLRAMPNGSFAKRMNLPKWKQMLFSLAGKKFDKIAEKYGVTYDFIFVESNGTQLQEVANIFEERKIMPSIDTVYDFEDINKALEKIEKGHSKGKTVIKF